MLTKLFIALLGPMSNMLTLAGWKSQKNASQKRSILPIICSLIGLVFIQAFFGIAASAQAPESYTVLLNPPVVEQVEDDKSDLLIIEEMLEHPIILDPAHRNQTTAKPFIAGSSLNGTLVEIYIDGSLVGNTKTVNHPSGTGNFFWNTVNPLANGVHIIEARSVSLNNSSQVSQYSQKVEINIVPFGGPTLLLPDAITINQPFTYIEGVAHNNSRVRVIVDNVLVDTILLGEHESGAVGFHYTLPEPISAGSHTIYLQSEDKTGRRSVQTKVKTVTILAYVPPTILSPADGMLSIDTNPLVTGVALNGSTVEIWVDGILDGSVRINDHSSGVGNFGYKLKNSLIAGKTHMVEARSISLDGKASGPSRSVSYTLQFPFIPPTLVRILPDGANPTIGGVASNNSKISLFVNGVLDQTFTPENHESGTLYFERPLVNIVSTGTHIITAQAFDSKNKPSLLSNKLWYTYNVSTQAGIGGPIVPEDVTNIESEIETKGGLTERDITVKETEGVIEVIDSEPEGTIDTEGATSTIEDITDLDDKVGEGQLDTVTNWPLVLGLIILIGLAIIFIIWYLGQKRKLLNEGIDKLFSDEDDFGPPKDSMSTDNSADQDKVDTPSGSGKQELVQDDTKGGKDQRNHPPGSSSIDDIPPPPPAI